LARRRHEAEPHAGAAAIRRIGDALASGLVDQIVGDPGPRRGDNADGLGLQHPVVALEATAICRLSARRSALNQRAATLARSAAVDGLDRLRRPVVRREPAPRHTYRPSDIADLVAPGLGRLQALRKLS